MQPDNCEKSDCFDQQAEKMEILDIPGFAED